MLKHKDQISLYLSYTLLQEVSTLVVWQVDWEELKRKTTTPRPDAAEKQKTIKQKKTHSEDCKIKRRRKKI